MSRNSGEIKVKKLEDDKLQFDFCEFGSLSELRDSMDAIEGQKRHEGYKIYLSIGPIAITPHWYYAGLTFCRV